MASPFEQLCGAAGDVKELEYISALHQTDIQELRRDASIRAEDIQLYLCSRYGILVTQDEVRHTILQGLAGSSRDDEVLDLMEVVAILLIPTLIKAANQQQGMELPDKLVKAPSGMLEYVLKMILHDVTGSSAPKELNTDLLQKIFLAYGEREYAYDETLLKTMVEEANSKSGKLDVDAFANALVADVQLYDLRSEVRLTTNYEDVFLTHMLEDSTSSFDVESSVDTERGLNCSMEELRERLAVAKPVRKVFTAPAIDITSGGYRSKMLMVVLWAAILITYFAYYYTFAFGGNRVQYCFSNTTAYQPVRYSPWRENYIAMGCDASEAIVSWLIFFVQMSLNGLILVSLGSIGNYVGSPVWKPLVGASVVFLYVTIPFIGSWYNELSTELGLTSHIQGSQIYYMRIASFIFGMLTVCLHLIHVFAVVARRYKLLKNPIIKKRLAASSVLAEMHLKHAAASKISAMTKNALDVVSVNDDESILTTHFGQALDEYGRSGKKFEVMGGFVWTWKRILSREAFAKDGIWISTRLIGSNITQFIVSIYILLSGIYFTKRTAENYDEEASRAYMHGLVDQVVDTAISDDLATNVSSNIISVLGGFLSSRADTFNCSNISSSSCTWTGEGYVCDGGSEFDFICPFLFNETIDSSQKLALLNASGFESYTLREHIRLALQEATDQSVDNLYPSEKYMVVVPLAIGTVVAFFTAVFLALTYIPSVTKTILQLRSGAIETLRDKTFKRYRVATDQVAILTGSLFWGCFVASLVVGGFTSAVLFFFLWQATAYYAQRFVAIVIGLVVVAGIRFTMVSFCRCHFYNAFYRRRPGAANMVMLALEWGNFALSAGFVFVRAVKLLIVAGANIGRIDRPFLARGVGVCCGRIELDNFPTVHTKDLLSQEAHRHPYIELLGVVYLMKLRYQDNFGKQSGSCWRLLFVYALFPWLHRYRVNARPELFDTINEGDMVATRHGLESVRNLAFISLRKIMQQEEANEFCIDATIRPSASVYGEQLIVHNGSASRLSGGAVLGLPEHDSEIIRSRILQLESEIAFLNEALTNEEINPANSVFRKEQLTL